MVRWLLSAFLTFLVSVPASAQTFSERQSSRDFLALTQQRLLNSGDYRDLIVPPSARGLTGGFGYDDLPPALRRNRPREMPVPGDYGDFGGNGWMNGQVERWPALPSPCETNAKALVGIIDTAGEYEGPLPPGANLVEPGFRSNCFTASVPKDIQSVEATVRSSIGVFADNSGPFCSGFLSADRQVTTARHCFFSKTTGQGEHARSLDRVRFYLLSDLSGSGMGLVPDQMRDAWDANGAIRHPADRIEVMLQSVSPAARRLEISDTPKRADLFLIGLYSYTRSTPWQKDILWSAGQSCRIKYYDGRACIFHGCQSTPGFSGSPLLTYDKTTGAVAAIGMHIGGARGGAGCPNVAEATNMMGNLGIRLKGGIR